MAGCERSVVSDGVQAITVTRTSDGTNKERCFMATSKTKVGKGKSTKPPSKSNKRKSKSDSPPALDGEIDPAALTFLLLLKSTIESAPSGSVLTTEDGVLVVIPPPVSAASYLRCDPLGSNFPHWNPEG